jgi:hypothetical protein
MVSIRLCRERRAHHGGYAACGLGLICFGSACHEAEEFSETVIARVSEAHLRPPSDHP